MWEGVMLYSVASWRLCNRTVQLSLFVKFLTSLYEMLIGNLLKAVVLWYWQGDWLLDGSCNKTRRRNRCLWRQTVVLVMHSAVISAFVCHVWIGSRCWQGPTLCGDRCLNLPKERTNCNNYIRSSFAPCVLMCWYFLQNCIITLHTV